MLLSVTQPFSPAVSWLSVQLPLSQHTQDSVWSHPHAPESSTPDSWQEPPCPERWMVTTWTENTVDETMGQLSQIIISTLRLQVTKLSILIACTPTCVFLLHCPPLPLCAHMQACTEAFMHACTHTQTQTHKERERLNLNSKYTSGTKQPDFSFLYYSITLIFLPFV